MPSHQRLLRTAAVVLGLALVPGLMISAPWLAALLVLAAVGGVFLSVLQYWANRHGHAWGSSGDVFGRVSTDVINMTSIKVAGLGGLGLVVLAVVVALSFRLTAIAMVAGLTGGTIGALLVILYRRRRGPIGSSSQRPGARVMLEERRPAVRPEETAASRRLPRVETAPVLRVVRGSRGI